MARVTCLWRAVFFNVAFMIESYVIWQHVDFLPRDGSVAVVGLGKLLNFWFVRTHYQVAIHTNIQAGYSGMIRALGRRVTVQTLHLVLTRVKLM
jgi:hypothetical protein